MKKIITILIISFVRIGEPPLCYQNNAFIIILFSSALLIIEIKRKPFGIPELNYLNRKSNFLMISIIFGGLISSINQETNIPFLIMFLVILLNIYFLILFFKKYLHVQLAFPKETKLYAILKKIFGKYWLRGIFSCLFTFL